MGENPEVEQVPRAHCQDTEGVFCSRSLSISYELHPEPKSGTIQLPLLLIGSQIITQLVTHATGFGPIK